MANRRRGQFLRGFADGTGDEWLNTGEQNGGYGDDGITVGGGMPDQNEQGATPPETGPTNEQDDRLFNQLKRRALRNQQGGIQTPGNGQDGAQPSGNAAGIGDLWGLDQTQQNYGNQWPSPPVRAGSNNEEPAINSGSNELPPELPSVEPRRIGNTRVQEPIGAERLGNPNQKSPKDIFLAAAQHFDSYDPAAVLTAIQNGEFGEAGKKYYSGWTASGDKLIPPANRQDGANGWGLEWGEAAYADPIDVVADMGGENPGWNWGVQGRSSKNPTGGGGANNASAMSQMLGQTQLNATNGAQDIDTATSANSQDDTVAKQAVDAATSAATDTGVDSTTTTSADSTTEVDPFAAMGGGVKLPSGGWVPKDHPAAIAYLASQGSDGSGTGTGTGTGTTVNKNDMLWQQLMDRAKQGINVTREDQAVRGQADAYSAQEERARRNFLSDTAERNSPYSTGTMDQAARMSAASMGQRVGAMEASLIGKEIQTRRNEIQHALDSMGSLLTEQQRQALTKELAQMDNALERHRIDSQGSQFAAGLSQADRHFYDQLRQSDKFGGWDNDFRWAQLGQGDSQWRDRMGFDVQSQRNFWDWLQRGNSGGQ